MVMASPRRRTSERTVVVLLALLLAGSRAPAQSGRQASGTPAHAAAARTPDATVVQAYRSLCLECHDHDGRGAIARDVLPKIPDFTTAAWQASRTDAELSRSIREGKGKSMPRMTEKLGSVDVSKVVAFVRGFQGGRQAVADEENPPAAPAQPAANATPGIASAPMSGTASRNTRVLARPGDDRLFPAAPVPKVPRVLPDGTGTSMRDTLPRIPDFSSSAWQSARTDARLVVSVLQGKGTDMPAFRAKVSREQARALVAVIRAFSPSTSSPAQAAASDFEDRFRALTTEFERLRQQSRELTAGKPAAADDSDKARPTRSPAPGSRP